MLMYRRSKHAGFTLIELMIVVAIVAILAGIAYPSYRDHVRKTARKEALGQMLSLSQRMEKIRAQTYSYAAGKDLLESNTHYTISVSLPQDNSAYSISAIVEEGDDQANDPCGAMAYASDGTWAFENGKTKDDCF